MHVYLPRNYGLKTCFVCCCLYVLVEQLLIAAKRERGRVELVCVWLGARCSNSTRVLPPKEGQSARPISPYKYPLPPRTGRLTLWSSAGHRESGAINRKRCTCRVTLLVISERFLFACCSPRMHHQKVLACLWLTLLLLLLLLLLPLSQAQLCDKRCVRACVRACAAGVFS